MVLGIIVIFLVNTIGGSISNNEDKYYDDISNLMNLKLVFNHNSILQDPDLSNE